MRPFGFRRSMRALPAAEVEMGILAEVATGCWLLFSGRRPHSTGEAKA